MVLHFDDAFEKVPSNYEVTVGHVSEPSAGFSNYCQQTTLHGWMYLDSESGLLRRFIWIIVISASCFASVNFVVGNAQDYSKSVTIASIESTTAPLRDITFPSVYVCNINQVQRSFLDPLGANDNRVATSLIIQKFVDGIKPGNFFTTSEKEILDNMTKLIRTIYNWNESYPFIKISAQNCSEMIVYLEWSIHQSHKFYTAFQAVTDYGACCLIIPYLDLINNVTAAKDSNLYDGDDFHSIPKGAKNGIQNGLKLVLDVETFENAYFSRGAKGFRIALSNANDQAAIEQDGFFLSPGTESLAAITPTILKTSDASVERFTPERRDCYLDQEFGFPNLRWNDGYRYSIKNCLYASVLQRIITECNCMPSFVRHNHKNLTFCIGEALYCAIDLVESMGNDPLPPEPDMTKASNNKSTEKLKCRQRCEMQTETLMTTTSDFPILETFSNRPEYCLVLQKLSKICSSPSKKKIFENKYKQFTCSVLLEYNNTKGLCKDNNLANVTFVLSNSKLTDFLFDYAKENFVVLNLYIKDPYYTLMVKNEQMTTISFIGSAGGLLGLCMGMSFVSIFEIVYHCCNSCVVKAKRCFGCLCSKC